MTKAFIVKEWYSNPALFDKGKTIWETNFYKKYYINVLMLIPSMIGIVPFYYHKNREDLIDVGKKDGQNTSFFRTGDSK
jgi:hypothetical protein